MPRFAVRVLEDKHKEKWTPLCDNDSVSFDSLYSERLLLCVNTVRLRVSGLF